MDSKHSDIVEKIRKCLALATSPNLNESAAAAEMAQRLMLKYNIELYDIERADASAAKRSSIVAEDFSLGIGQGAPANWRRMLVFAVARHNFCKGIAINGRRVMTIVGEKHNIQIVEHLYAFLTREIDRLADVEYPLSQAGQLYAEAKRLGGQKYATEHYWMHSSRSWKNSFRTAAVEMLDSRLWKFRQGLLSTSETALVITKEKQIDEATSKMFPQLGKFQKTDYTNPEGRATGYRVGNNIPLNAPIESAGSAPLKLK